MMNKEQALGLIAREFAKAAAAKEVNNDGMVRVCARRAAGVAIRFWLQSNPRQGWGADAMNQLRNLQLDQTIPSPVRDAAMRLSTRITEQFTPAFSNDPVEDGKTIIDHLLNDTSQAT